MKVHYSWISNCFKAYHSDKKTNHFVFFNFIYNLMRVVCVQDSNGKKKIYDILHHKLAEKIQKVAILLRYFLC